MRILGLIHRFGHPTGSELSAKRGWYDPMVWKINDRKVIKLAEMMIKAKFSIPCYALVINKKSLSHTLKMMGMRLLRQQDYPKGKFTLAFFGDGDESDNTVIELTCNWGVDRDDIESRDGSMVFAAMMSIGWLMILNAKAEK